MKEPFEVSRSPLGYLAAFALGIVCMAMIVLVTRQNRSPETSPAGDAIRPEGAEPSQIHFQREGPITAPLPTMTRGTVRQQFPARAPLPAEAIVEEPVAQEGIMANQEAPIVVSQPVTVVAGPQPAGEGALGNGVENSRISGRAFLSGPAPQERLLPLDPICAAKLQRPVTTRFYVTGKDNSLADVLVVITAGLPRRQWAVPREPVRLRIRGCIYENHIVAVQTGQPLLLSNLDDILHNIHLVSTRAPEQNRALLPGRRPFEYKFSEPERSIRFKCDVHPWEFAHVSVIEHPFFALTDANGNFSIRGLPPGDYTIQAYHRKAGLLQKEITVRANRNTAIDFEFKAPAPQALKI